MADHNRKLSVDCRCSTACIWTMVTFIDAIIIVTRVDLYWDYPALHLPYNPSSLPWYISKLVCHTKVRNCTVLFLTHLSASALPSSLPLSSLLPHLIYCHCFASSPISLFSLYYPSLSLISLTFPAIRNLAPALTSSTQPTFRLPP